MFQGFTHRAVARRAAMVSRWAGPGRRQDARCGKIVRMHELINVVAAAEHGDVVAFANPLKENLENAQPPMTHDGPRADDRHVESALHAIAAERFAFELRASVSLAG